MALAQHRVKFQKKKSWAKATAYANLTLVGIFLTNELC